MIMKQRDIINRLLENTQATQVRLTRPLESASDTYHWRMTSRRSSRRSSDVIDERVHVCVELSLSGHLLLHLSPLIACLPLIQLISAVCLDTVITSLAFRYVRVPTSQLLMSTISPSASSLFIQFLINYHHSFM